MKKNIFMLVILTLALVGCKDNAEVRSAIGTYSYKTSGMLVAIHDTVMGHQLVEQGSLEVISQKDGEKVIFTFNQLLGDTYSTTGTISGDSITLQPFTRNYTYLLRPVVLQGSGGGKVYDENILLTLQYQGMSVDSTVTLYAKDVQLIAKKNK